MSKEIRVPTLGESVTEATIAKWFKKEGDAIKIDEPLVELETDKVTVEVPAPADGAIESISVKAGDTVQVGTLLGSISEGAAGKAAAPAPAPKAEAPKPAAKVEAAASRMQAPALSAPSSRSGATAGNRRGIARSRSLRRWRPRKFTVYTIRRRRVLTT